MDTEQQQQQPKVEVEEQNINHSKSEENVPVVSDDPGDFSDVEMEQSEEKEVKKPPQQGNEKENSVPNSVPNGFHEKVNKTHETNGKVEVNNNVSNGHPTTNHYIPAIKAQIHLPRPEPPPQRMERSQSVSIAESMPSIGKYIRDRSSTFSAALVKRLSSFREDNGDFVVKNDSLNFEVTEFKIPGVKVIVKLKSEEDEVTQLIGRVTFFTKSNCRDSTAVRKFLREKGMRYVEINVDVFPKRAKELVELTGSSEVPQIFFNEKLLGGLVTLNSLRNSGELDKRMKEMLSTKCPDNAPAIPVYGFDDEEHEQEDELVGVVKAMRQCLPIEDRFIKMKIAKNCFAGDDLVEAIIHHLDCGRKKIPIAIGVSSYKAVYLYKGRTKIASKGDVMAIWRVHKLVIYCALGVLAGILGGMLGLGGGFIMGPLFLEMGIPPQVASATSTFVMLFSAAMAVVEYYLLKRFPVPYALYFAAVATIAAFVGQYVVGKVIKILGRASIIIFILAAMVFCSAISLGGLGLAKMIRRIERHEYMGFDDICSYQP